MPSSRIARDYTPPPIEAHDAITFALICVLRTTNGVPCAFAVDDVALTVTIIGIFYGGQDYEAALQIDEDN